MLIDTAARSVLRNAEAPTRPALRIVLPPAPAANLTPDRPSHRESDASERSWNVALDALAALSIGVFVVDTAGGVRLMNAAAERIARGGCGICICHGRLRLSDARLDARLRNAILCAGLSRSADAGQTIVLRTHEGQPISLLVRPVPADSPAEKSEALAVLFVSGPARRIEPAMDMVRAVYGLTPAETRVLAAILGGQRPCEYAAANSLSCNTVQTHMKALYTKTGCHSQAGLVGKILSDPMLRLSQAWETAQR